MLGVKLAFVLALACFVIAEDDDGVDEKFVKVLTDKNFDKNVNKGSIWLVEFYAPWCGHCKSLKPVWAEAARKLAADNSAVRLGKVDATANPALTRRFSIQGYPTIKLFKEGRFRGDYSGGRTESEIIKFAKQASGSALVTIGEGEGVQSFAGQQDISFLLVGVGSGNVPTIKAFEKIAEEESVFGSVGFASLANLAEVNEYLAEEGKNLVLPGPSLLAINTGEITFISSQGQNPLKLDDKNIAKFVSDNKVPFFPELSPSKNWKLTKEGKKTVLAFVDHSRAGMDEYLEMMKNLKRQLSHKLVFGWVDAPSNTFLLEPIGLKLESLPAFVVVDIPAMTYFKSPFLTEEAEIKAFLERVADGKEKALPINEKKDEQPAAAAKAESGGGDSGVSQQALSGVQKSIQDLTTRVNALNSRVEVVESRFTVVSVLFILLALFVGASFLRPRKQDEQPEQKSTSTGSKKNK